MFRGMDSYLRKILTLNSDVSNVEEKSKLLPKKVLFLHIQKTAGTSIIHTAAENYGNGNFISHGDHIGRDAKDFIELPFVSGHFGYEYAKQLMKDRICITFLRDPIERVISHYYFCRSRDPNEYKMNKLASEYSLEEFLLKSRTSKTIRRHIYNNQTWQLALGFHNKNNKTIDDFSDEEVIRMAQENLDTFDYVGMVENYQNDIEKIAEMCGWRLPEQLGIVNKSKRKEKKELSNEILELLKEVTKLDYQVYNYALNKRKHGSQ